MLRAQELCCVPPPGGLCGPKSTPLMARTSVFRPQLLEQSDAAHLVHEGEELVEEVGDEGLDARQVVLVEGIHQISQRSHSIHAHLLKQEVFSLKPLCKDSPEHISYSPQSPYVLVLRD